MVFAEWRKPKSTIGTSTQDILWMDPLRAHFIQAWETIIYNKYKFYAVYKGRSLRYQIKLGLLNVDPSTKASLPLKLLASTWAVDVVGSHFTKVNTT